MKKNEYTMSEYIKIRFTKTGEEIEIMLYPHVADLWKLDRKTQAALRKQKAEIISYEKE